MKRIFSIILTSILILATYSASAQYPKHPAQDQPQNLPSPDQLPSFPVVADGDTLFFIKAKKGGMTPSVRAEKASLVIEELGRRVNLKPENIVIEVARPD